MVALLNIMELLGSWRIKEGQGVCEFLMRMMIISWLDLCKKLKIIIIIVLQNVRGFFKRF
jgi:hypothetical protein